MHQPDLLNDGEILGKYFETINPYVGMRTSKEKWWSGGWVADMPFVFKLRNKSVAFVISILRKKLTNLKKAITKKSSAKSRRNGTTFPTFYWIWGQWSKTQRSTWQKSSRESLKREQEVLFPAEELKAQGSVDENTRAIITRGLKRIRKNRKEEDTLKELLGDVQDAEGGQ